VNSAMNSLAIAYRKLAHFEIGRRLWKEVQTVKRDSPKDPARNISHNSPYIFPIFRQINISWEPLTHCVIKAIFEYLSLVQSSFFPPLGRSRCAARLRVCRVPAVSHFYIIE
jgi:hypothetical protein